MKYLKAEHLKFKRTISNKLIWIAPFMTAIFAWIIGGFYGFQYMTFYWWYAFLLPGTIAVLCFLANQKEERSGKYYSVLSLPIDLKRFELAKAAILIEKIMTAALILAFFVSISNIISPATVMYSVGRSIMGSISIVFASIWQIPLCLYLARKAGMIVPVVVNTLLGIFLPTLLGKSALAWICPYCWAAKLAQPLLGIEINGTFLGNMAFSWAIPLALVLSALLYTIISFWDANDFSRREGS